MNEEALLFRHKARQALGEKGASRMRKLASAKMLSVRKEGEKENWRVSAEGMLKRRLSNFTN